MKKCNFIKMLRSDQIYKTIQYILCVLSQSSQIMQKTKIIKLNKLS